MAPECQTESLENIENSLWQSDCAFFDMFSAGGKMGFKSKKMRALLGCAVTLGLFGAAAAKADVTQVVLGWNIENQQTGPSTVALYGTFFSTSASLDGNYSGGTLTYPGSGSPQTLTYGTSPGPNLFFQTGYLPDLTTLEADYPTGTYTVTATGSDGPSSVTTSPTAYLFGNMPALTAASYSALQGLDAGSADTVDFNGFTLNGAPSESFVFFDIYNATTSADVFSESFLPSSTSSVVIPGGTLAADTKYRYELIYDERIDGTDPTTYQLFDNRTFGYFTTPEPSSVAILLTTLAFLWAAGTGWSRFFVRKPLD
jgi:hypothetical protein